MAVSSTNVSDSYTGNGSTTQFASTFQILDSSQVKVSLDGTPTAAFTFNTGTGVVTMNTAPAAGVVVKIYRETTLVQATDYMNNAEFPAETHELALDRLVMICQELAQRIYELENP